MCYQFSLPRLSGPVEHLGWIPLETRGPASLGSAHRPNRCAVRAFARAASSCRFFGAAFDSSEALIAAYENRKETGALLGVVSDGGR